MRRTGVHNRLQVITEILQAFEMSRPDVDEYISLKRRLARLKHLDTRVTTFDFTKLSAIREPSIEVGPSRPLEDHLCDELRTCLEPVYRDERLQREGVPSTELWRSRINILEINRILKPHKLAHLTSDLIATL